MNDPKRYLLDYQIFQKTNISYPLIRTRMYDVFLNGLSRIRFHKIYDLIMVYDLSR